MFVHGDRLLVDRMGNDEFAGRTGVVYMVNSVAQLGEFCTRQARPQRSVPQGDFKCGHVQQLQGTLRVSRIVSGSGGDIALLGP